MRLARRALMLLLMLVLGLLLRVPGNDSRSAPRHDFLTGQVRDANGSIAGAAVRFKGEAAVVCTRADGRFRLPRPAGRRRVVAWKPGYFIGGTSSDADVPGITLHPLPTEDCETYAWTDPTPDPKGRHNCANCHGEIYREWSLSGHAQSARNRRFLNLIEGSDWHGRKDVGWSLRRDHPDGAGVCNSCHAPTAGFDDNLADLHGVAAHGVHCDYCHKIAGTTDTPLGLTHGRFGLRLLRPAEGQLFFGPLADVDRGDDAFSPLYRSSRYCASCHEGVVFGVHVYSTYSEWLASPARQQGQQCQSCHMAPTGRMTNIAPGKGGIRRDPDTLANHRFFAGSQEEMLRQCLHVGATLTTDGDDLRARVELCVEGAGHRVPTGFIDRHLLLVVDGLDAGHQAVPLRRGDTLPPSAGKEFAGRPGQLYARQLRDFDEHTPAPFWIARPEFRDTRLSPGQATTAEFCFGGSARQVRVQLLYRRFWPEVAQTKGWPDDTVVVVDRVFPRRKE